MAKRTKLFERIKNNPNDVAFAQIETLLLREGFIVERTTGSHHVFVRENISFVIPRHGKRVKSVYAKRVIEMLEEEIEK